MVVHTLSDAEVAKIKQQERELITWFINLGFSHKTGLKEFHSKYPNFDQQLETHQIEIARLNTTIYELDQELDEGIDIYDDLLDKYNALKSSAVFTLKNYDEVNYKYKTVTDERDQIRKDLVLLPP
jgi:chromosome segregation ATPase